MPFPWKKVKSTKISQLFSDHLESHRRQRGHLVVETGFPTSLVDLFVKNRDRLKKPKSSKKKKKKKDQNIDNSSVLSSSFPSPSPSSSPLIPRAPCTSPLVLNLGVSSSSLAVNGGLKEIHERPNAKGVLGAIFRMSFVVVLALGAKKFAVGLFMSALLLFFVEFIGKKSYRFLEPCSGVKRRLRSIMQSIFQVIISFRKKSFEEKFNSATGIKEEKLGGSNNDHGDGGGGNPKCEIMIAAEPMFVGDDGGIQELPLQPLDQPSRGDFNKEEEREPKKGKRAKMKSKIKRLFPRKFRGGSKKEKRDLETQTNPTRKEEGIVPILDKDKEKEAAAKEPDQNEQSISSRSRRSTRKQPSLSLSPSSSTTQEGNDGISTICNSDEEINSDGILTGEEGDEEEEEEEEEERKGKNCCGCFTTCVIVLVGLTIGGKFLALVFVVLWFLMLKSGEMLRRYIHTYI